MGLFEKRRAKNFFQYLQNWKEADPATHQGEQVPLLALSLGNLAGV